MESTQNDGLNDGQRIYLIRHVIGFLIFIFACFTIELIKYGRYGSSIEGTFLEFLGLYVFCYYVAIALHWCIAQLIDFQKNR